MRCARPHARRVLEGAVLLCSRRRRADTVAYALQARPCSLDRCRTLSQLSLPVSEGAPLAPVVQEGKYGGLGTNARLTSPDFECAALRTGPSVDETTARCVCGVCDTMYLLPNTGVYVSGMSHSGCRPCQRKAG